MSNIAAAFVKAKKAFRPALKEKANPAFKGSKYADLSSCIEAVDDAFLANGIVMYQECHPDDSGVTVETVLLHESGESIRSGRLHVPASKQDPQGFGSALTYARRYSLMAACGMAPEDDDGNAASRKKHSYEPADKAGMSEADVEAHQIAMHKAQSSEDLRAVFGVAYKAANAIGDDAAINALQYFYETRKKTLAETKGAAA
jgi:hypothetical protein